LSLKKYQEAELLLASWLKTSSPVSGELWYVRGLAASKLEQLKQSQMYFQKARQGGLSHWALFWNLGYAAAKLGQARQASEFVVEALKDVGGARGERQAWMQLVLAESALKQNNGAGSVALTRRFLNSFPTDPAGWELLSRALKRMGKRAESVKAGMKLDELEAQLRYYLTDRYLFAPNGPFSGLP
jgi:tetratricopeptide (TPR) repeat protein